MSDYTLKSTIRCEICKREMKMLNKRHLIHHNLTLEQYKLKFPDSKTISEASTAFKSKVLFNLHEEKRLSKPPKEIVSKVYVKRIFSEEHKRRISEVRKQKYASGEIIHHMTGKHHSEETKKKISKTTSNYKLTPEQRIRYDESMKVLRESPNFIPPMLGKIHSSETKKKISNASYQRGGSMRKMMESRGKWIPKNQLSNFKLYEREVSKITEQNVDNVLNYDKSIRGLCKHGTDNHQIDHVYSIVDGFKNNVAPEILGHHKNLRFIHWKENLSKWDKSEITLEELCRKTKD